MPSTIPIPHLKQTSKNPKYALLETPFSSQVLPPCSFLAEHRLSLGLSKYYAGKPSCGCAEHKQLLL